MVQNRWDNQEITNSNGLDSLVYRSNLLGSDRSVVNIGGGNTSTKTIEKDFKGNDIEVMWVKGSGSDLATMQSRHFTGLKIEDIRPLMQLSILGLPLKHYYMHFYHINMLITHIRMQLLVLPVQITVKKLRRRFTETDLFGCHTFAPDSYFQK